MTTKWKEKAQLSFSSIEILDYTLTDSRIILGDLENGPVQNTIILLTKKVIYDSFKKEKKPSFVHVQNETKNFFYLEKYSHYIQKKAAYL